MSKHEVNSVASVFHPFIIHLPSSVAQSYFDFHICAHRFHVDAFLRVELNLIREVVALI